MAEMKRTGHDLIGSYDRTTGAATFADGTTETPEPRSWRHVELEIAATHPAIREVHVSSVELGVLWITAAVTRDQDLDGFPAAVEATARPLVSDCHRIEVRCAGW